MRLSAKRILLIEPDEFQALIFADMDKYYDPHSAKFGRFERTIETPLGCDLLEFIPAEVTPHDTGYYKYGTYIWIDGGYIHVDLDIKYNFQIDISWPKSDREPTIKFQDLGGYEVTAWYGGSEIEYIILWTDSQYEQFIKRLKEYINS